MTAPRSSARWGGIEAGGTKYVLGIGNGTGTLEARTVIPTTEPAETIERAIAWFRTHGTMDALGIASFGPIVLDKRDAEWGSIGHTPKAGWSGTPIVAAFAAAFDMPIGFDTDVNGAALAEAQWGAGIDVPGVVYLTVGTGVGGGAVVNGTAVHGLGHPEMGHIRIPRHPDDRDFPGICPFHADCCEGLTSGTAIQARWGAALSDLTPDHPAHDITAWYLAQLVTTLRAILAPGRIMMGGGVMKTPGLIERVQAHAENLGRGYFIGSASDIIVRPALGDNAGLLGAILLGQRAS